MRGAALRSYLESHPVRKLQLGAGHNLLPGWLNTDRDPASEAVQLDAAKPFPFADGTFDYVFSEHLIEHLPHEAGVVMLEECHRVSRPGGRLRIATPDLEAIISLKGAPRGGVEERYAAWITESYFPNAAGRGAAYAINQVFRGWGHRFLYDCETLRAVLEKVGFGDVRRCAFGESEDEALAGIDDHGVEDGNRDFSEFETMVLEATRY